MIEKQTIKNEGKETVMDKKFIVIAEFFLKPGTMDTFIELAMEDSKRSVADEEGCLGFDVLVPQNKENVVILYETYVDAEAFEAHKSMPHYKPFVEGIPSLLSQERTVQFLTNI